MTRKTQLLMLAGVAAGIAVYRSLSRHRFPYAGTKFKRAIYINRPAMELYNFWRNVENLPKIAQFLKSVEALGPARSRWTIAAPGGISMTWESEITTDRENRMIGWRSSENSMIETAGYVMFEPEGSGTVVRVALEYFLPSGKIGTALAKLFGKKPDSLVEDAMRRFRRLMENGESSQESSRAPRHETWRSTEVPQYGLRGS